MSKILRYYIVRIYIDVLSPVLEVNNLTCFLVMYVCFSRYECHTAVCQPNVHNIYVYILP
jgi:hypothetical protein